jgi:peptide/nickel transport system substrate-binding protein
VDAQPFDRFGQPRSFTTQPCGSCNSCRKIASNNHPDIIRLKPSGPFIKIDQIRTLCQTLAMKPYEAAVRVVIISDAQAMNPAAANALLDELGLTGRDRQGTRLLPDGRPMHLIVETAGESDEQTDTLELIGFAWESLGIKTFVKPRQRDVVRGRISSGETLMSAWTGLSKAVATPGTEPEELAPHHRFNPQWPKWGAYEQSDGSAGEATDLPEVRRLLDLLARWNLSVEREERQAIWQEMLEIHADQVFTLGTVSGVPQPIVVSERLVNLPSTGIYAWYPGANFGMYGMDGIWFEN